MKRIYKTKILTMFYFQEEAVSNIIDNSQPNSNIIEDSQPNKVFPPFNSSVSSENTDNKIGQNDLLDESKKIQTSSTK